MTLYDPLGHAEWRAWQREKHVQAVIREYEDLTGKEHPQREDGKHEQSIKTTEPDPTRNHL